MKTITFLRHGEARPRRETNTVDEFVRDELSRELTEKGRAEVPYLGEFDLVVSSPAWRAIETATIAAGRKPDRIVIPLSTHLWPTRNDDNDWELVDAVFVNGGDKRSLAEAYASATQDQKKACERISSQAMKEILNYSGLVKKNKTLVVGHALHLQTMAREFWLWGEENGASIWDIVLGTGEYFTIIKKL